MTFSLKKVISTTMFSVKYQLASVIILLISLSYFFTPNSPKIGLNTTQLIEAYNYKHEVHHIQTKDNYILTHFRIPTGRNNVKPKNISVLIMHGLLNSAAEFVFAGPEKSLALILADRGYDVWLGNSRGTTFSRNHTVLDPDNDAEYWNFSLHEMAMYDIPASIDYILNVTNSSSLHYIGLSQGVYEIFVFLSENPEYCQKIRLISAMSPTVFVFDIKNYFLKLLVFSRNVINSALYYTNTLEFGAKNSYIGQKLDLICGGNPILKYICLYHFYLIQGGTDLMDEGMLPILMSNMPAGVSTKQFIHMLQIGGAGIPQKYDYGKEMNLKVYGSKNPPQYSFKNITAPIALYYSKTDRLCNSKNIKLLNDICPNIVKNYKVPEKTFYQMDFVAAKNVADVLYKEMVEEIENY